MNLEAQITRWNTRIDAVTYSVDKQFGHLKAEQLNWKPATDKWSIAEVLSHIIQVNNSYVPILASAASGEQDMGFSSKIGFVVRWLGDLILRSVEPTRAKKMKTFPIWEPAQSDISGDILVNFKQQQEALKRRISDDRSLLEKDIVIPSPANRYIVYRLSVAFEIMVTHEERHLKQALQVQQQMR